MSAGTVDSLTTVFASLSVVHMLSALTPESKGSSLPDICRSVSWELVIPYLYTSSKMTSCGQQGLYIPQGLAGPSIACLSHEPTLSPLSEGSNTPFTQSDPILVYTGPAPTSQWPPGFCLPAPLKTP